MSEKAERLAEAVELQAMGHRLERAMAKGGERRQRADTSKRR